MMKSFFAAALMSSVIAGAVSAQAVDVSTVTCADLGTMQPDGVSTLIFWIDGYMGGAAEDPSFDLDRMLANIDGAIAVCNENPDALLMDVLSEVENG